MKVTEYNGRAMFAVYGHGMAMQFMLLVLVGISLCAAQDPNGTDLGLDIGLDIGLGTGGELPGIFNVSGDVNGSVGGAAGGEAANLVDLNPVAAGATMPGAATFDFGATMNVAGGPAVGSEFGSTLNVEGGAHESATGMSAAAGENLLAALMGGAGTGTLAGGTDEAGSVAMAGTDAAAGSASADTGVAGTVTDTDVGVAANLSVGHTMAGAMDGDITMTGDGTAAGAVVNGTILIGDAGSTGVVGTGDITVTGDGIAIVDVTATGDGMATDAGAAGTVVTGDAAATVDSIVTGDVSAIGDGISGDVAATADGIVTGDVAATADGIVTGDVAATFDGMSGDVVATGDSFTAGDVAATATVVTGDGAVTGDSMTDAGVAGASVTVDVTATSGGMAADGGTADVTGDVAGVGMTADVGVAVTSDAGMASMSVDSGITVDATVPGLDNVPATVEGLIVVGGTVSGDVPVGITTGGDSGATVNLIDKPSVGPGSAFTHVGPSSEFTATGASDMGEPTSGISAAAGTDILSSLMGGTSMAGGMASVDMGGTVVPSGGTTFDMGGTVVPSGGATFDMGDNIVPSGGASIDMGGTMVPSGGASVDIGGAIVPGGALINIRGSVVPSGGASVDMGGTMVPSGGATFDMGGNMVPSSGASIDMGGTMVPSGGASVDMGGTMVPSGGATFDTGGSAMPSVDMGGTVVHSGDPIVPAGGATLDMGGTMDGAIAAVVIGRADISTGGATQMGGMEFTAGGAGSATGTTAGGIGTSKTVIRAGTDVGPQSFIGGGASFGDSSSVEFQTGGNFVSNLNVGLAFQNTDFTVFCHQFECNYPACYVPLPGDCKSYVVCQRTSMGTYVATRMRCAFGSYWTVSNISTCERVEDLQAKGYTCGNDPCRDKSLTVYPEEDTLNCRSYWRCHNGVSKPQCCPQGQMFDSQLLRCIDDPMEICRAPCPLKQSGCSVTGVRTQPFYDGNCRTYWDCENGHPHPLCCAPGFGYDSATGECQANDNCQDDCPAEYLTDVCGKITETGPVLSYSLFDGNCRTFMKCNPKGYDEAYCCRQHFYYNTALQRCEPVLAVQDPCYMTTCPGGYTEECRFTKINGNPMAYLDVDAGIERPCANGTVEFDETICTCRGSVVPMQRCKPEVVAKFDHIDKNWEVHNYGDGHISSIRELKKSTTANGLTYGTFDGSNGMEVWRYGTTTFPEVTLKITFQPVPSGDAKQIIASNCDTITSSGPSFEVSLDPTTSMISFMGKTRTQVAGVSLQYNKKTWNSLTLLFDGQDVLALIEDPANPGKADSRSAKLTGALLAGKGSLRFGPCNDENSVPMANGFTGFLSEVRFSKCMDRENIAFMKEVLRNQQQQQP